MAGNEVSSIRLDRVDTGIRAFDVLSLPDGSERLAVALDAAWEIEALASMLQGVMTPSVEGEYLVVRGVSMRMKELAGIVMSAVDDAADTLPNIRRRLTGDASLSKGTQHEQRTIPD